MFLMTLHRGSNRFNSFYKHMANFFLIKDFPKYILLDNTLMSSTYRTLPTKKLIVKLIYL